MHAANNRFWREVSEKYNWYFDDCRVYEFGSFNINDADNIPRSLTSDCDYFGIDWRPGPNVDIVSLAHEFDCEHLADSIFSASMLEHDPYWEKSLENMVRLLKNHGIMIITWGAANNGIHEVATAPDQQFHSLPAGFVINKLQSLGMSIQDFHYEGNLYPDGTMGEVVLVAFKGGLRGNAEIDELLPEDAAY